MEFKRALVQLKKQGAVSLVIDLRDNGGGYGWKRLLLQMSSWIIKKLIVLQKIKKERFKTFATEKGIFQNGKVC
jgi:carboxyl-terminal processing protease